MPPVFGKVLTMLQDAHGREFSYLRLSITDVCNYRCNYCLPDGYQCESKQQHLSLDEIKTLVSAFARNGIEKVRITGGEPSLRRDLCDIITVIKNTPGIKKVALTTNAHQLDRHVKAWANAGLDALNVSCDSLDGRMLKAIIGRNNLTELLNGLAIAQTTTISSIKINTVLLKQYNYAQIQDLIAWVKDKPISLRFIELMQTLDNKVYFEKNHVSAQHVADKLTAEGWQAIQRSKSAGPAKEFYHPDSLGKVGFIAPYSKDFCQSCNRLRISSLGKLHLCLFGEAGHDLRPLLTKDKQHQLDACIDALLNDKPLSHFLHQGISGCTSDLAMLGG